MFVKRVIEIAFFIYIAILCAMFYKGGFSHEIAGIRISANSPVRVISILTALATARILIGLERKNALAVIVSVILSLFMVEAGLRISGLPIAKEPELRQWRRLSKTLGWELIPQLEGRGTLGVKTIINSHGLRDVERSWEKAEGEYRILALGDSFTYGYALEPEETYVKQLESLFASGKQNVDVINGGVIAYNLYQSLTYLKQRGMKYDPDLVIYFFWIDDVGGPNDHEEMKATYNELLQSDEFAKGGRKNVSGLYLVNMLNNAKVLIDSRLRPFTSAGWLASIEKRRNTFAVLNQSYLSGRHDLEPFKNNLYELENVVEEMGSKLLVVFIPDAVQVNDRSMQKMNRILGEMCSERQIPFLDITPVFEKEPDAGSLYLFPLDAHTSAKGDRIIAEIVYEKIKVLGLR